MPKNTNNTAYQAGRRLLCGDYTQYTPTGKSYFQKAGRYGLTPKLGAVVYYYSSDLRRVSHVGIVVDVNSNDGTFTFVTIEGNTSATNFDRNGGGVYKKYYTVKSTQVGGTHRVNGFGYPLFSDDTCTVEEFIDTALNEEGYQEKASNACLDDKDANAGSRNFTKYGKWYGNNGDYWCQQFVSWCAFTACVNHFTVIKTGWKKLDDGRWRYILNGEYIRGKWQYIDERWYAFDDAGYMIKGWFIQNKDGDKEYYYLNKDGAMLAGQWFKDTDGKYYYLTKSGVMAVNAYVYDENHKAYCWVEEDGSWNGNYNTNPDLKTYEVAE